jgi:hypothetical protein
MALQRRSDVARQLGSRYCRTSHWRCSRPRRQDDEGSLSNACQRLGVWLVWPPGFGYLANGNQSSE